MTVPIKKIVILDHNRGRLANQLWNFMSIYAYCLEKGYRCENYSFFDHADFFNVPLPKNPFVRWFFFGPFRNKKWFRRLRIYDRYLILMKRLYARSITVTDEEHPLRLPPTPALDQDQQERLASLEHNPSKTIYTVGWMFRDPVGLHKYREAIIWYFMPKRSVTEKIESFIAPVRAQYPHVVGVHIRQTDYEKKFGGGQYFFTQSEVRKILDDYLRFFGKNIADTVFVICSDGPLDAAAFAGLNITMPHGTAVEDLFTLARTDVIIGSNSTYGPFASYYGNIPFMVFDRTNMEWEYYRDKTGYFENKKSTLVFY
ncbi:MAG: hypothetical protein AAB581_00230 [Patescibacteria group bacterium]